MSTLAALRQRACPSAFTAEMTQDLMQRLAGNAAPLPILCSPASRVYTEMTDELPCTALQSENSSWCFLHCRVKADSVTAAGTLSNLHRASPAQPLFGHHL